MIVMTAIAVVFSSASKPIHSAILTAVAYAAGHLSNWIIIMAEMLEPTAQGTGSAAGSAVLKLIYYLVPNLESFNIRNLAVHSELASVRALSAGQFADTMLVAACWAAIFL